MKLKIPFVVSIFIPSVLWSGLCGLWAIFLILGRTNLTSTETGIILQNSSIAYLSMAMIVVLTASGFLRFLGIKIERKVYKTLNDEIIDNRVPANASGEKLKELMSYILKLPENFTRDALMASGGTIFLVLLTAYFINAKEIIITVIIGGALATILLVSFVNFFAEYSSRPILKEIEKKLMEKSGIDEIIKIKKKYASSLKKRLNYFILFLALTIFAILNFLPKINFSILFFSLASLFMVSLISKLLLYSYNDIISEIQNFAERLPKKEKAVFISGNVSEESLNLSQNLNKSAEELYEARKKERNLAEELQKKVAELEKWYKLTVGRELRMVELKKEIKEKEEEIKKLEKSSDKAEFKSMQ